MWVKDKEWCFKVRRALMKLVRYQNGNSVYGSVQREPLYAFCGLEARSSASVKNFSKVRTMAKMVTEHRKVGSSDTK